MAANISNGAHSDTYLVLSVRIIDEDRFLKFESPKNSVERMLIILIQTLISLSKTQKSLINQGFPIKNKHRFYDTLSYHNYGAYLV